MTGLKAKTAQRRNPFAGYRSLGNSSSSLNQRAIIKGPLVKERLVKTQNKSTEEIVVTKNDTKTDGDSNKPYS
jgi:hypothetical protein